MNVKKSRIGLGWIILPEAYGLPHKKDTVSAYLTGAVFSKSVNS